MLDTEQIHEAVRPLATEALRLAMEGDFTLAARTVERINREHGGIGVLIAMTAWIDTCVIRMGVDLSRPIRLCWLELGSGQIDTDAGQVPPEVRWAGQVFAARAVLDKESFNALIRVLPDDPVLVGNHVEQLLHMAAFNLNNLARVRAAAAQVEIEAKEIGL